MMNVRKAANNLKRPRVLISVVAALGVLWSWQCLPSPLFMDPYSTVLLDRDGILLGATIAADEQWRFPPAAAVPERYTKAVVAYEDHRFFSHPGVDPLAVARALQQNICAGRIVSGASTISMQVIRLSRKGKPRTVTEKIREMVMALRLEIAVSKEQILALYSSHAPYGGNVVGLQAAAWRYFGREPDQLSWAESAMLAVLPNSPSLIHPGRNRKTLLNKRDGLLDRLWRTGEIDSLTCALAKLESLPSQPHSLPMLAPHLLVRVKASTPEPAALDGSTTGAMQAASRHTTTLKKEIQVRATRIVQKHHRRLAGNGIQNAAALILEVETGAVVAYIGNVRDSISNEHHHHVDIIRSPRSTGSILKPLLYAGMLQAGELLPDELVADVPTRIAGFAPENYSRTYQGAVPASMALARSLNIPAVRMLYSFGTNRFYSLLRRLGMTTLHRPANDYGLSLILGGAEGTLWDLTGIYAGVARCVNDHFSADTSRRLSFYPPSYQSAMPINGQGRTGSLSWFRTRIDDDPLDAGACWLTLKAMLEVPRPEDESVWREFTSSRPIAWKTATSQGYRDAWAIGVTPRYAVGVWVGNADGEGRPGLTGLTAAAPILFELFGLLDGAEWFDTPESRLREIEVCAHSGSRVGPNCAETKSALVTPAGLRSEACRYCRIIHCDSTLRWRVNAECERLAGIRSTPWFVLPPTMEWYYRGNHSDYRPLPPPRPDCVDAASADQNRAMAIIYPQQGGRVYIPAELDGSRGRTVFEVAHRDPRTTVFWHLDGDYLGLTVDIHKMSLAPEPGKHSLVLVDEDGQRTECGFTVLGKNP